MKKIFITLSALAVAMAGIAQEKLDMRARALLSRRPQTELSAPASPRMALNNNDAVTVTDGVRMVTVGVVVNSDDAVSQLEARGADVSLRIGDYVYCSIPVDSLESAAEITDVRSISLQQKRRLLNNLARTATNVDAVHAGTDLPSQYTGEGVIIGIFDGGFDANHINFYDAAQSASRVDRLWKFTTNESTGKTTSRTYTNSTVGSFTTDDTDETHGTHVLGIATGAYAKGSTDYSGMAPGARIAISCGQGYDEEILQGVNNIIDYAEQQGKPCVINMSLGTNLGHHDGTDVFNKAIDRLAERAPICIAAGNEGDLDIAIKKTLTSGDLEMKTFLIPNSSLQGIDSNYQAVGDVEILGEDNSEFDVTIGIYSTTSRKLVYTLDAVAGTWKYVAGADSEYSGVTDSTFDTAFDAESYFGVIKGISSDNNRYIAYVSFNLYKNSSSTRYLPAIIVKGKAGKRYEMYGDGIYTDFTSRNVAGWDDPTGDGTINDMACGKNTIIVGGYATRNSSPYSGQTVGDVLDYSSWGTLADGRNLPHICTPGQALISSFSKYYVENSNYYDSYSEPKKATVTANGRKHYWSHMGGTSMATPVMTGVAALWLQANPNLTPAQIREIAVQTAVTDSYVTSGKTAASPVQWGAGKLDALEGLKMALSLASVDDILADGNDNIIITSLAGNVFDIFGASEPSMNIYLTSMSGVRVLNAVSNGDRYTLDASSVQPGIYVLTVGGTHSTISRKVVIR